LVFTDWGFSTVLVLILLFNIEERRWIVNMLLNRFCVSMVFCIILTFCGSAGITQPTHSEVQVALQGLQEQRILNRLVKLCEEDDQQVVTRADLVVAFYEIVRRMPSKIEIENLTVKTEELVRSVHTMRSELAEKPVPRDEPRSSEEEFVRLLNENLASSPFAIQTQDKMDLLLSEIKKFERVDSELEELNEKVDNLKSTELKPQVESELKKADQKNRIVALVGIGFSAIAVLFASR
jgi:hypothetical protein